ncbi:thiol reductant ABC exporter subunit CydC [Alkalicoccus chagannorensis]|uniref:thiol reductant ABC exporter subunit CydC n=1 Tax=Alkalicoccus chagannorensis TaxID=427072 RepID=UPI000414E87D|nr:thiol reductant ABC exporter subunit CydC [Alkalicoccus chagannorensis]
MNVVRTLLLKEKKDIALSILFGFLAGIGAVALFANSGYLISRAAVVPPLYVLTVTIALLKLFSFTRALSRYGERLYSHRATFTMLSRVRTHFFERLIPLAPRLSQQFRSGDLLARVVGDVEAMQDYFLRVFYPPLVMVTVFLATIAFTLFFSPVTALILVAGLVVTGLLIPLWHESREKRRLPQMRAERGELSSSLSEFFAGFRDLALNNQLSRQEEEILQRSTAYEKLKQQAAEERLRSQTFSQLTSFVVTWVILAAGAAMTAAGNLEGVFLAMLVMISLTVFENTVPMAAYASYKKETTEAANRLDEVLSDDSLKLPEAAEPVQLPSGAIPLSWEGVSLQYEHAVRPALHDVWLDVEPGSKTAVVGASGSGKSTLLQLALRFSLPEKGEVKASGIPLANVQEEALWERTNAVLQEQHFFYGTVEDNLRLASATAGKSDMIRAMEQVQLAYIPLESDLQEGAANLSGGERQRLALARALLRRADLWLLDEPVSSVDPLTSREVMRDVYEAAGEATLILVSHDLQGLEEMDCIVVMDQGEIQEVGTYETLMQRRGLFHDMKQVEAQVMQGTG